MNRSPLTNRFDVLPGGQAGYLHAAQGWLELGDHASALAELEKLALTYRYHPEALKLRWAIYSKAEKWEAAFQLADFMTQLDPLNQNAEPFLQRSYAASRMTEGGVEFAYELLQEVFTRFRGEPVVSFQLACYACQLGWLPQARVYIRIALAAAEKSNQARQWQLRALFEQALEPLWPELQK